jgi:signal transduction histidine kinase
VAAEAEATVTTGADFDTEYRLMTPTGELRWLTAKGRRSPGGNDRLLGVLMDVTSRHEAEHERTELREHLAHAGRVSMMGLLASSMAHELNQPLGAILRNAEAAQLLLSGDSADLDEIREILRDIQRDDQRAGDVITRLRGLLAGHSLEFRAIALGSLVDEVLTLVKTEAAVRHVRLVRAIGPAGAVVRGDAIHLQQVLLNFIMNAIHAMDSVGPGNREIHIDSRRREDGMLEVAVVDTGPGVPANLVEKIFEPFYTTKATGMGMGLSICRTIIEAHGGRIWVDPDRATGAAFCFTLPLEPEAGEA